MCCCLAAFTCQSQPSILSSSADADADAAPSQDIAEARGNDPHLQLDVAGGPDFSIGALPVKAAPYRNHHQQQQHIQAGRSAAPGKGSGSHPSPSQQEEAAGAIPAAGTRLHDADAKRSSLSMRKPAAGSASGAQLPNGASAASAGALAAALDIAARDQAAAAAAASTSKDDAAAAREGAAEAGDDPPQTAYNSLATWLGFSRSSSASSISSRRASESSDAQARATTAAAAGGNNQLQQQQLVEEEDVVRDLVAQMTEHVIQQQCTAPTAAEAATEAAVVSLEPQGSATTVDLRMPSIPEHTQPPLLLATSSTDAAAAGDGDADGFTAVSREGSSHSSTSGFATRSISIPATPPTTPLCLSTNTSLRGSLSENLTPQRSSEDLGVREGALDSSTHNSNSSNALQGANSNGPFAAALSPLGSSSYSPAMSSSVGASGLGAAASGGSGYLVEGRVLAAVNSFGSSSSGMVCGATPANTPATMTPAGGSGLATPLVTPGNPRALNSDQLRAVMRELEIEEKQYAEDKLVQGREKGMLGDGAHGLQASAFSSATATPATPPATAATAPAAAQTPATPATPGLSGATAAALAGTGATAAAVAAVLARGSGSGTASPAGSGASTPTSTCPKPVLLPGDRNLARLSSSANRRFLKAVPEEAPVLPPVALGDAECGVTTTAPPGAGGLGGRFSGLTPEMEASLEGELLEDEGADVVGVLPNEGLTLALGGHHALGDMDSEDEGSFCSSAHSQAAAHTAMVEGVPLDEFALRAPSGYGTPDRGSQGRSPRAGAAMERQAPGPLGIICRSNSGELVLAYKAL